VVHSRDDEVGVAHESQKPASIFPDDDGAVLLGKTKPKKLSDQPKMLSKSCHGIFKKIYLTTHFLLID